MPDHIHVSVYVNTKTRQVLLSSKDWNWSNKVCATNLKTTPLQEWTIATLIQMLQANRLKPDEIRLLGSHLYTALFKCDDEPNLIGKKLEEHHTRPDEFLHIELEFDDPNEPISSWPFESAYCMNPEAQKGGYFIATEARCAITRRPHCDPSRTLRVENDTVRVLFVAASPRNLAIPVAFKALLKEIDALQWVDDADRAKSRRFELLEPFVTEFVSEEDLVARRVPQYAEATWDNFNKKLEELSRTGKSPHVVHFVGHGECSGGVGRIAFVKPNYEADWIDGDQLGQALQLCKSVKLVFLQACESGMPTQDVCAPFEALSSVARSLASLSIPAVVAMQSEVEVITANNFAKTFYDSLVKTMPVYEAVQIGRRTISQSDVGAAGIPVLYLLRYCDEIGILFPATEQPAPMDRGSMIPSGTSAKIVCAWCNRLSNPGSRCSFQECRGQLRCPNCKNYVKVASGNRWDPATEVYDCECGRGFYSNGVLEPLPAVRLEPGAQADSFDGERTAVGRPASAESKPLRQAFR